MIFVDRSWDMGSVVAVALFLVALAAFLGALITLARSFSVFREYAHNENAEHAFVVMAAIAVIAFGNVMTGLGFMGNDQLVEWGAIVVRGALLAVVTYLLLRHPKMNLPR